MFVFFLLYKYFRNIIYILFTQLVRHNTRKQRASHTESIGVAAGTSTTDIPLNSLEERQDEDSGIFDQVSYGIISVGGFIYQNSYIFTNILMMVSLLWDVSYKTPYLLNY